MGQAIRPLIKGKQMIWIVAIGLLILFSIMARMIYVLVRDREDSFKWKHALERSIHDAGWAKEYERACRAASERLAVERSSR